MRKHAFAALVLAALLWSPAAQADEIYRACMDEAFEKFGWGACGQALEDRSRARLDESWQRFVKEANPAAIPVIDASRPAWEAYLESACEYYRKEPEEVIMSRDELRNGYRPCRSQIIEERRAYIDRITELYVIHR